MSKRLFKIEIGGSPFSLSEALYSVYEMRVEPRWFGKPKVRWLWRFTSHTLGGAEAWVNEAMKLPKYIPEVE